ncbi:hypothetical protein CEP52_009419 [Fusarium oligoseptatum]|uniref:AAA+ ATPase domain-containing protein n=1 Tax=Fusarium oligoseptatum TaxID=2604345 RepID=A0A428TCY6_9HYPO|nr:hypothetical protein CEP52_009419 [Fusarium oligoseptatum]
MSITTKLYKHVCNGLRGPPCPDRWSKFPSHDEDQAALEAATSTDPIVHRHVFRDHKWQTSSFTVQSPAMRALFKTALAGYQDLDLELENWTFEPPFMPIVHRWDKLRSLCEGNDDKPSTESATQLMNFLRLILAPQVDSLANTRKTGNVRFEDLWQIFPPHELVVTSFYDVEALCRVAKYELIERFDSTYWKVTLEYLDWNGHRCGYATTKVTIPYFPGHRRVVSLPVYPLSFQSDATGMRKRILERGRIFESLRGYHFRACTGTKILLEKLEARPVNGRVIIDAFAYYLTNDIVKPDLTPLDPDEIKITDDAKATKKSDEEDEEEYYDEHYDEEDGYYGEDDWDRSPPKEKCDRAGGKNKTKDKSNKEAPVEGNAEMTAKTSDYSLKRPDSLEALTDDQCLLANPWVKGLDLKTKEWAQFFVDDLSPIAWNDDAFTNLVLPGSEKQLAWEFVENKALANDFDDFIQDKGRGLIILMFGPPGVGKTYTAEAVAEQARVPLYAMSAGELGTVPKDVEAALSRALTLCGLWNAMLLLDEADVFLSARTDSDLTRNELVAVFLTKLEYYTGVCFLTTNRITSIDPAFESRVDLFLPYKDLTVKARRKVWENFINCTGCDRSDISSENLDELAKISLNGREIKNLIKSAHLLSLKSGGVLKAERLFQLAQNRMMALEQLQ